MPGYTPRRNYPFPLEGEPSAGHTNMQDLGMAIDADHKEFGIGFCAFHLAAAWPVPTKGVWHRLPFANAGGTHPEWGNPATGMITVPAPGVYSLQYTGACYPGTGIVTMEVGNLADPGLFMQDSSHHIDTGKPFVFSISNVWQVDAGALDVAANVMVQDHSVATPIVWGTLVVARVEPV